MIQQPSVLPSVQRARRPIVLAFIYLKFGQNFNVSQTTAQTWGLLRNTSIPGKALFLLTKRPGHVSSQNIRVVLNYLPY